MPTKITVNCMTGETQEVEMEGEELAAHEALLAAPNPPLVTLEDMVAAAVAKVLAERGA